jgi:hypothetical protein
MFLAIEITLNVRHPRACASGDVRSLTLNGLTRSHSCEIFESLTHATTARLRTLSWWCGALDRADFKPHANGLLLTSVVLSLSTVHSLDGRS